MKWPEESDLQVSLSSISYVKSRKPMSSFGSVPFMSVSHKSMLGVICFYFIVLFFEIII